MSNINFLNTKVDNLTMAEALSEIDKLTRTHTRNYIVTPNVDHIVRMETDKEFKEIYDNACLVLTDGTPLIWISKLLRNPIKEKVSGSDLFPKVCELAAQRGYKVFLLGAAEGIAEIAATKLTAKFSGLNIVGTFSPKIGFENDNEQLSEVFDLINSTKPDILFLGLGTPKQEKFYYKHRSKMDVPMTLAVGASIDFEAGNVKRAPQWMQRFGLEWFYRLCKEPKRMFKRYIVDDTKIFYLAFKYRKVR